MDNVVNPQHRDDPVNRPPAPPASITPDYPKSHHTNGGGRKFPKLNTHVSTPSKVLVVLLIVASLLVITTLLLGIIPRVQTTVKEDKYQAVFLLNGQVYFGKLDSLNNEYVILKDIYYLQVEQTVQPNQQSKPNEPAKQPNVSLVKLGNELHGPEDEMFIVRDKVVFWENLKDDGKVVQAIKENQNR